jgi:hypothetical protein
MKDQANVEKPSVQDAQALVGVAIAGDPELEIALDVLATQANRKSGGRKSGFKAQMEASGLLDNTLTVNDECMVKANARKHHERCEFAEGKTLRECADSQYFNWDDLRYDIKTMRYLTIVDGPNYDPNAVEE